MSSLLRLAALSAVGGLVCAGCSSSENEEINFTSSGLEVLSEGAYEGWLVIGDEKISTGVFTDPAQAVVAADRSLADADKFVITLEPVPDTDAAPSGVILMAGDVVDGKADLSFGADLGSAAGQFILRTPTNDATNVVHTITLALEGLDPISSGTYEGWLIYGDEKVSTGVFTDPANVVLRSDRDPLLADKFVLTIEPTPDADPGPSGVIVLAGDVDATGALANLAFPMDLSTTAGSFILKTPTDDATNANNDEAGVWFAALGANGPEPVLTLPALPDGWIYEGWGVTQGTPLTTGRFSAADAADLDSPYSDGGPPFPGEDFLMNLPAAINGPVDMADGASLVVVTIEPQIDGMDPTGAEPFGIKILGVEVPAATPGGMTVALNLNPFGETRGTATFGTEAVDDDEAGVWFLTMGANGPEAALQLPALPDGFVYEGWAVTQGTPLSTGRFKTGEGADLGSPYSDGGPPFPGEDFLMNLPATVSAVDLTDGMSTIVISVEPDIDGVDPTGDGPFAIKPLAHPIAAGAAVRSPLSLGAGPQGAPSGSVSLK